MRVITLGCPDDILTEAGLISMPEPTLLHNNAQNPITLTSNWPWDDMFTLGDTVITYTAEEQNPNVETVMCQFTVTVQGRWL